MLLEVINLEHQSSLFISWLLKDPCPKTEGFSKWPGLWEKQEIWRGINTKPFSFDILTLRMPSPAIQKISGGLSSPVLPLGKYLLSYQLEDSPHAMSFPFHHCCIIQLHFIFERSLFTKRKSKKNMFCHLYAKPIVSFLKAIIFRY